MNRKCNCIKPKERRDGTCAICYGHIFDFVKDEWQKDYSDRVRENRDNFERGLIS